MKYIYVDNFRGFKNALIPILDVNFLVGENSTGKTSLLTLIKLLSLSDFWFGQQFGTSEISFGHFNDIVSIHEKDRTYFSIGYIQETNHGGGKGDYHLKAFLMTFKGDRGIPHLKTYIFNEGHKEITINFTKKDITYNIYNISKIKTTTEFIKERFSKWTYSFKRNYSLPKKLPRISPSFPPAHIIKLLILHNEFKKQDRQPLIPFTAPLLSQIVWLAPIRTKPKRTYDEYATEFSPEGAHTPYLIKKILDRQSDAKNFLKFTKKFGEESGLFESVSTPKYNKKSILSPFELDVVLNKKALNISNVGYGVSQSLPIIVELFTRPVGTSFAIQQPEIHLHPKAQAALGDVLYQLSLLKKKKLIIETHSDYIIDRFRLNYKKKGNKAKPKAQILFFQRATKGNEVYPIPILDNGEFHQNQPRAYRDFFIREELKLIES